MQEVSDFLEMLREEMEELIRENNWLKEQASRNEEQIREYGKLEVVLKDTLVSTQEMVKEYKETARKEAELILKDAELKAENHIREAQEKAIKIHEDITDLKGIRRHYREELIRLLDNHRRMVEFDIRSEEDQGSEI
jgi:cell division initiation protein